ncbi:MAG: hypothetical protein M3Z25_13840 [Actinomycetota bacterium]|nr:hypothetical protein [Actinomycetota bacterium]
MDEMTDPAGRAAWRRRHEAIRAEVAEEEAEAIEAEIAEKAAVLEVPLHLRIDRELDIQLRQRAAEAQIPLPRWFGACSGRRSTGPRARVIP